LGVWARPAAGRAYVADFLEGLSAVDVTNLADPRLDTTMLAAGLSEDITIQGSTACVASDGCGMKTLDVSVPERPREIGSIDSTRDNVTQTVAARDSFAFIGWGWRPWLRSVDILDPANPTRAGGIEVLDFPKDMVLRDSFLYVTEGYKFQVVNVARPRQPTVAGSCASGGEAIVVQDTFAYTAAGSTQIVNVARPDSPYVVSAISGHSATGLAVQDTFLYIPYAYDTLFVYSVADPLHPRQLGFAPAGVWPWDVALGDSAAFVSTSSGIDVFELPNPAQPVKTGSIATPYHAGRLTYAAGILYVTMWDAGVAIYETVSTGLAERGATCGAIRRRAAFGPNPVTRTLCVKYPSGSMVSNARLLDATGRDVRGPFHTVSGDAVEFDVSGLVGGVYFVRLDLDGWPETLKFIKQ
jgi:hypothetical protein